MTKRDMLSKMNEARALLEKSWIAGNLHDFEGGHCALGCIGVVFNGATMQPNPRASYAVSAESKTAEKLLNAAAMRRYPDYEPSMNNALCPVAFVNDIKGKDAIIAVYDDVISQLEVAALCEREQANEAHDRSLSLEDFAERIEVKA